MTGGGATVLRAAIMSLIALLARATGRTSSIGRTLILAGVLMVLQNPSILLFDPSFQLSFLASLGLIYISPIIEKKTTLFINSPIWREVFISTFSTQCAVLPLLLYQTGMFSVVSLPVNILILPIIPFTMLSGFIAGIITAILPAIGPIVMIIPYLCLSWMLSIAQLATFIPFASVSLPINEGVLCLLYAVLLVLLWREYNAILLLDLHLIHEQLPANSSGDKTQIPPQVQL